MVWKLVDILKYREFRNYGHVVRYQQPQITVNLSEHHAWHFILSKAILGSSLFYYKKYLILNKKYYEKTVKGHNYSKYIFKNCPKSQTTKVIQKSSRSYLLNINYPTGPVALPHWDSWTFHYKNKPLEALICAF